MSDSSKADYSGALQNKYKCNLGSLDLFDRVINLKLTTKGGEQYVIRSDYEIYFPKLNEAITAPNTDKLSFDNLGKWHIRKCQNKPSIKIQYKRYSVETPISIDIFLHNFYMLDKDGKMVRSFSSLEHPLSRVDVEMGYFGQFDEMMKANSNLNDNITIDQLFDFTSSKLAGHGITFLTMSDVEYVQTDKLPPDMTVHIHGYVGNFYMRGVGDSTDIKATYEEIIKNENKVIDFNNSASDETTLLGKILFENVTKNWVNSVVFADGNVKGVEFLHPDQKDNMTLKKPMTDVQAKKFGVIVYMSKGMKEYAEEYDKEHPNDNLASVNKASSALGKVKAIISTFNFKNVCVAPIDKSGDILVYKSEELKSVNELIENTALSSIYKNSKDIGKYWGDGKLPAVYNITTDALCTIVCPFFFLLNPFQKFKFKSSYALSGMVSYYANFTANEDTYYALWQNVSFATVEDINECNIVCTGDSKEEESES